MDPVRVVTDFCNAIPRRDVEELLGFFANDAVYHNIPVAPVQGREAIASVLKQFLDPAGEAEFELLAIAVSGDKVLTERVDRFRVGDKKISLPVMGTFEVDADGRIRAWRDYFDLAQFTKQMGSTA
jgi:limonene-1,2-epoxide hydrolase